MVRQSPPCPLSDRRRHPARRAAARRRTGTTAEKVWEDAQLGQHRSCLGRLALALVRELYT